MWASSIGGHAVRTIGYRSWRQISLHRGVNVIATPGSTPATLAAKAVDAFRSISFWVWSVGDGIEEPRVHYV